MYRLIRCSLLSIVLCASPVLDAQSVGDRVRITTSPDVRYDGFVLESSPDRFQLRLTNGYLQTVSREAIVSLERYMGKRRYKLRGFLIGAGVGSALGLAATVSDGCSDFCFGEAAWFLLPTVAVGGATGTVGLLIGAMFGSDKWQEVPTYSYGSLRLAPMLDVWSSEHSGHNIRFGLSASW